MASSGICLACGGPAVSGDRRLIGEEGQDNEITTLWKEMAARESEKRGESIDFEIILRNGPFMCRTCFRAYGNLMRDMKVL